MIEKHCPGKGEGPARSDHQDVEGIGGLLIAKTLPKPGHPERRQRAVGGQRKEADMRLRH